MLRLLIQLLFAKLCWTGSSWNLRRTWLTLHHLCVGKDALPCVYTLSIQSGGGRRGQWGHLKTFLEMICWVEATRESLGTKINHHHYRVSISKEIVMKNLGQMFLSMCFHGQRLKQPCHWMLRSLWVKRWRDGGCILYFLLACNYIWKTQCHRNANKLFQKKSLCLAPIILIVLSMDAQYFMNLFLSNIQRRREGHLTLQRDFGIVTWHSKIWPKSRPRKSYISRILYPKCPSTLTLWSLPFCWQDMNI